MKELNAPSLPFLHSLPPAFTRACVCPFTLTSRPYSLGVGVCVHSIVEGRSVQTPWLPRFKGISFFFLFYFKVSISERR